MPKILILTNQHPYRRGFNDFFPIFKWQKELKNEGIEVRFIFSVDKLRKNNVKEIIAIDSRWIQSLFPDKNLKYDSSIYEYIKEITKKFNYKILIDNSDGCACRSFWLTPLFDRHLKKQILKDREKYLINEGDRSLMPWIPDNATPSNIPYTALKKDQLHKLGLSWNIGMLDYRYFPFKKYLPIGTNKLLLNFYKNPIYEIIYTNLRLFDTAYRGAISKNTRYSCQRILLIEKLKKLQTEGYKIILGGKISINKHIKEMKQSKIAVSPFGWGEICYRDFESILLENVLLKPSMEHLETYPNIYKNLETYVSFNWDFSDFETKFKDVINNYSAFINIAKNA